MSVFDGTFVRAGDAHGKPAELVGPGTIEVGADRLVVRGRRPRARLANVLSILVGVACALAVAVAFAFSDVHVDDVRLPGVVAVAVAAAAMWACRLVLGRALGFEAVAIAVPFAYLARAAVGDRRVVVVTTLRELPGLVTFETAAASSLADELEHARGGAAQVYRG